MSTVLNNKIKKYTRDAIHLLALKKPITIEFHNNLKASGYMIEVGDKYELIPITFLKNSAKSRYYIFDINAIKNIKYYNTNQIIDKELYV